MVVAPGKQTIRPISSRRRGRRLNERPSNSAMYLLMAVSFGLWFGSSGTNPFSVRCALSIFETAYCLFTRRLECQTFMDTEGSIASTVDSSVFVAESKHKLQAAFGFAVEDYIYGLMR